MLFNLVELVEKVRFEKRLGVTKVFFKMISEIDGEWIDWSGDRIDSFATPIFDSLNDIWPEDIKEGEDSNMKILQDLTGMDSGYIQTALKVMEDAWLEKFEIISKATGYNLSVLEIKLEGGEC